MSSHEVILVVTPEPTSILDAYALLKNVNMLRSNKNRKFWLLVNKAESKREAERVQDHFVEIAQRFLQTPVEKLGCILSDEIVTRSVKRQRPYILDYPKCTAAREIQRTALQLLDSPPKNRQGNNLKGLLKRFVDVWKDREGVPDNEYSQSQSGR
jgi:flagellar biosynthesis protein FlhG